jgi:hypothetical protein
MKRTQWSILAQLLLVLFVMNSSNVKAAEIVSFYPTGSVKQMQQVTVRFSADMVAMGDPRSKIDPFTILCKSVIQKKSRIGKYVSETKVTSKFTTRWADNKNWILDFERPLKSGIRCVLNLRSDVKDLSGARVEGIDEYSFSTSGPGLLGISPVYGDIEPDQYFVALSDGAVDVKSIETKSYFEVEGMPDKVGVIIINGKERETVIKAAIKNDWRWNAYKNLIDHKPTKPFSQIKEMDDFIVLAARRRFPEGAKVILHWPLGILSKTGVPVEEPQHFEFKVIELFQANFSCERSVPEHPCNPILDMHLKFSKHVPLKSLKGVKLVAADGKTWIPVEISKGDEQIDYLTFKGPFPESTKLKVVLPSSLKDELGRILTNQNKYPLEVWTDEYSPLIKFSAAFGILEFKADPVLPVSVRNIEKQMDVRQVSIEGKTLNLSSQAKIAEIINLYRSVVKKEDQYESSNSKTTWRT